MLRNKSKRYEESMQRILEKKKKELCWEGFAEKADYQKPESVPEPYAR